MIVFRDDFPFERFYRGTKLEAARFLRREWNFDRLDTALQSDRALANLKCW